MDDIDLPHPHAFSDAALIFPDRKLDTMMDLSGHGASNGATATQHEGLVNTPFLGVEWFQDQPHQVPSTAPVYQQQIHQQGPSINGTMAPPPNLHAAIQALQQRMTQMESENVSLRNRLAGQAGPSKSSSPNMDKDRGHEHSMRERVVLPSSVKKGGKNDKGRKTLRIVVPDKAEKSKPKVGLPTPLTLSGNALLRGQGFMLGVPVTPQRKGPPNPASQPNTSLTKRKTHSLDKMMPPSHVHIPQVPITDTELIVFFFQSLARPSVSIRLYARGWGPKSIIDALHEHRAVDPPYLRNTCSVKCTTAIKLGKKKYGDAWEETYKHVFSLCGDSKATELITMATDEISREVDFDIRKLTNGLTRYPKPDGDAGIFSICVQYCAVNNAPYTLKNVWKLAKDLQEGRIPNHPPSPDPATLYSKPKPRERKRKRAQKEQEVEHSGADDDAE
ncbi:hypothetical protein ACN47E_009705 [Coniothyrium glycines]